MGVVTGLKDGTVHSAHGTLGPRPLRTSGQPCGPPSPPLILGSLLDVPGFSFPFLLLGPQGTSLHL